MTAVEVVGGDSGSGEVDQLMSELILKIGDSPEPLGYRDGDVLHAFNDEYLLWQHTQRIVDHRKIGGGFFKPLNSMAFKCGEAVRQYKYERLNRTTIRRTLLSDDSSEELSSTPNAKGEAIDVQLFVSGRIGSGLPMFGDEATVVWFGGNTGASLAKLATLWTDVITPETGLVQANHLSKTNYRASVLKAFYIVVTDDFNNDRRAAIEEPDIDETDPNNLIFLAQRKWHVVWRNLSGLTDSDKQDIADKTVRVPVDRGRVRSESSIVEMRP